MITEVSFDKPPQKPIQTHCPTCTEGVMNHFHILDFQFFPEIYNMIINNKK